MRPHVITKLGAVGFALGLILAWQVLAEARLISPIFTELSPHRFKDFWR